MCFIAVTRFRARSPCHLPAFFAANVTAVLQARRSSGFLGAQLAIEPGGGFWTVTAWQDCAAMRGYRNSGAHRQAMPKLKKWADEASSVHWEQDPPSLPDMAEVCDRMARAGRPSPLSFPSRAHAAREVAPGGRKPRPGPRFSPARSAAAV